MRLWYSLVFEARFDLCGNHTTFTSLPISQREHLYQCSDLQKARLYYWRSNRNSGWWVFCDCTNCAPDNEAYFQTSNLPLQKFEKRTNGTHHKMLITHNFNQKRCVLIMNAVVMPSHNDRIHSFWTGCQSDEFFVIVQTVLQRTEHISELPNHPLRISKRIICWNIRIKPSQNDRHLFLSCLWEKKGFEESHL